MARTYNKSKSVFLAGPIEYWWGTEEEPDRFNSPAAVAYREHRDRVRDWFVDNHFLVYSPHNAFKGDWNEKMQPVNDYVLGLCDIVVDLTPDSFLRRTFGTAHEVDLAYELNKAVFCIPTQKALDQLTPAVVHFYTDN
jgi:nucleoside 2-deoxyribosyltransferase